MKELIGPYVATLRWVADDTPVSCWRHSGELLTTLRWVAVVRSAQWVSW